MFDSWFKLVMAGTEMAGAAVRTGEAVAAADRVIRSRSGTIAEAMRNPIAADYVELGRMIPEKMTAAYSAASDVMTESLRIWADASRHWHAPAFSRQTELIARSMGLYAVALAPFHATVTANDRRLRRKR